MSSMRVAALLKAVDEFREKLTEHRELWGKSLSQPIPDYPVRNREELEAQCQWLTRRLGGCQGSCRIKFVAQAVSCRG